MTDRHGKAIGASGTVHWVGAGLSTGSGLAAVQQAARQLVLWHRTEERAAQALDRLGLAGAATPRAYRPDALAAELREGDIVVSMLPAPEHARLLALCQDARAHFACSSYVSEAMTDAAPAAADAGTVLLAEAGLDPGVDHLFAHSLLARAAADLGPATPARLTLTSYCGGVPAVPNAFTYRFSWAPAGVLNALRSPARYLEDGRERVAERPWEATRVHTVDGEEFEAYPNRDSLPFLAQYEVPEAWTPQTFVRGTLRLRGWQQAWASVFDTVRTGDEQRIRDLATELAAAHPMTETDHDRVVLAVSLDLDAGPAGRWSGHSLLDLRGDAHESAMARCVSRPLALGIRRILDGRLPSGLCRPVGTAAESEEWLAELRADGLPYRTGGGLTAA
ncbi:saccharopine dehydrogenase family protein [Kitasatospora sp. NPDC004531]